MTRWQRRWLLCVMLAPLGGCGTTKVVIGDQSTRRGVEREYLSTPEFGGPRGREFEDIVPVGARITTVHVARDEQVRAIWLTYERNGVLRQTPRRGGAGGSVDAFVLDRDEKIIGIHAYGRGTIDELVVATNKRTRSFGDGVAPGIRSEIPWFSELRETEKRQYVGVGITGRVDDDLRQLSLRIQVRPEAKRTALKEGT